MSSQSDMQAVVAALRDAERVAVTSHEAPDGDALGSLLAMGLALQELDKDVVMFLGGPAPLPGEYRFLELERRGLRRERPDDLGERMLVAVLGRHAGLKLSSSDVFVTIAGGIRIDEPAADLAVALAIASAQYSTRSNLDQPIACRSPWLFLTRPGASLGDDRADDRETSGIHAAPAGEALARGR